MKIVTAEQMQEIDSRTFSEIGVSSLAVMESAGRGVADVILKKCPNVHLRRVFVFSGGGNNGGDGYVIARTLFNRGIDAVVFSTKDVAHLQGDVAVNAQAWVRTRGRLVELSQPGRWREFFRSFSQGGGDWAVSERLLFVDCLIGTGLKGEVRGVIQEAIEEIDLYARSHSVPVVSVDIPSGVESDTGRLANVYIKATETVALQLPKVGNLFFPGAEANGELSVIEIGLARPVLESARYVGSLLTESFVRQLLVRTHAPRREFHKGSRGHVLVVGGFAGMLGAVKLSGLAALKMGAGLVTLGVASEHCRSLTGQVSELMVRNVYDADVYDPDVQKHDEMVGSCQAALSGVDSVVIGPGMGQGRRESEFLVECIQAVKKLNLPLVLDADALNNLALQRGCLGELGSVSSSVPTPIPTSIPTSMIVLTPHPGEMARLLDCAVADVQGDRLAAVRELQSKCKVWVVLKGARTIIADPSGRVYVNPHASESLATAGSGDVLAGIIGGMLGRKTSLTTALTTTSGVEERAVLSCPVLSCVAGGVYIHGQAGVLLQQGRKGVYGITAGELLEAAPGVLNSLLGGA